MADFLFSKLKQETSICDATHAAMRGYLFLSHALKKIIPQNVWSNTKHSVRNADARKKYCESPWIPMVPGPDMSAKTLTNENAPLIIPNPSPET